MAIETEVAAAAISETAPMSPAGTTEAAIAPSAGMAQCGWLRRFISREYLPRSRRWKLGAAASATTTGGGGGSGGAGSRLVSTLSRSLRWKRRLPGFSSLSLRSGSASAALDAVAFRVMYVVEAVVLGLALSCFFLCCGCHL